MKQGSNPRRGRNRGGGKRQPRNSNFDSNGPEGRVRGTAQQVYEKYLALARDAQSAGDRVSSENYFQHAEHYFRILSVDAENKAANEQRDQQRTRRRNGNGEAQAGNSDAENQAAGNNSDAEASSNADEATSPNGNSTDASPAEGTERKPVEVAAVDADAGDDEDAAAKDQPSVA